MCSRRTRALQATLCRQPMAAAPPPPPRSPSAATRGPGGGPASPRRPPHHRRPRTGARTGAGRANAPPLLLRPSPATVRRLGAGRGAAEREGSSRRRGALHPHASPRRSGSLATEKERRKRKFGSPAAGGRDGAPSWGPAARARGRVGRRKRGYGAGRRRQASRRRVNRLGLSGPGPAAMPSPRGSRERRSARPEFASLLSQRGPGAPDSPSRRRESAGSAPPPLPEEDCMRLNPSFVGIALSSLLAVDLWASKRLGVCAGEASAWGSARPLLKVVEVSGHGIPWLLGTFYGLCQSDSSAAREVLLNLFFGEAGKGLPGWEDGSKGKGRTERTGGISALPATWLPTAVVAAKSCGISTVAQTHRRQRLQVGCRQYLLALICISQCGNLVQSMHCNYAWCNVFSPGIRLGRCRFNIFACLETAVASK